MMCLRGLSLCGLGLWTMVAWNVPAASAEELLGAEAALKQWQSSAAGYGAEEQAVEVDPLRGDLEAFTQAWPAMSAEAAAAGWLTLYDRWAAASASSLNRNNYGGFGGYDDDDSGRVTMLDVVQAIPGPDVWPTLKQQVEARPTEKKSAEWALRLLVFYISGDESGFQREAEAAVKAAEKIDPYMGVTLLEAIAPLTDVQREDGGDDAFRESISQAKASPDSFYRFEVPDLVTLHGEAEAREMLEEIVVLLVDTIEIEVGDATRRLATQIATEKIDALTVPRWELVWAVDEDNVALYEALNKKFAPKPQPPVEQGGDGLMDMLKQVAGFGGPRGYGYDPYGGGESWEQREARVIYLLGLIVLDRIDDAAALVEKHYTSEDREVDLPWGLMETLQRSGVVRPLFDFTERMIDAGEGDALWSVYIQLGAQLEESDRVLAKVEAALADVEGEQRLSLLNHLVSARLAADDVEQGVESLREWIELSVAEQGEASTAELGGYARLARIGKLMERDDWLNEGLERTMTALQKPPHREGYDRWERASARGVVVDVLITTDRLAEAEALLIQGVERAVRTYEQESRSGGYADSDELTDAMVNLTAFYGEAERWDDVLMLLNESPYWGVSDLLEVVGETPSHSSTPLAVYAARALQAKGQSREAWNLVSTALNSLSGEDALYALLVELDPAAAPARLDELFARDQFEERPLIWKAKMLIDAGNVEAADETIRRAISIDPSDGEQGPGDRMRAYAVFAEVLRAQGDVETAQVMEGAVRAIRMSEDADDFDRAGLLSRAVAMYKESLTHFADAYCIQSRLAIQLASLGRYDEAAAHYERAYELMPGSFGRVESHCFGCEGAFTGERAQTIAERVFDKLVFTQPFTPQVHYLRGYLRSSQGRDQEALADYREAVRLDPDYLNAWGKIQGLAFRMQIDREQRDRVTLEIFRLDPLGRHSSANLAGVSDLGEAWRAVESVQPLRVEGPALLWPLPLSAAWMEENEDPEQRRWRQEYEDDDELPTPGGFLADHGITQAAAMVSAFGR